MVNPKSFVEPHNDADFKGAPKIPFVIVGVPNKFGYLLLYIVKIFYIVPRF